MSIRLTILLFISCSIARGQSTITGRLLDDPEGKAGIININTKENAYEGLFAQANIRLGAPSIQGYDNAKAAQRYGTDFTLNYRHKKWNLPQGGSYIRHDIAGRREGDVFTIAQIWRCGLRA